MFEQVDVTASSLVKAGVEKGDNVILLMSSCPELVYLLLAINKIGAIANMINPLFSKEQIRDRINDTGAKVMFVLDQLHKLTAEMNDQLCVQKIVVIPIVNAMPTVTKTIAGIKLNKKIAYDGNTIPWKKFLQEKEKTSTVSEPGLPAIMVYSSGTTGASKGIVLMNKGINATIAHYEFSGFEYKRECTYLQIVPTWFSTGTVFCLFLPLCLGVCVIIEPVFSEENFTKDLLKYKPNMIMGATSLWLYFLNKIKNQKVDLSYITYPITGGEKILPETEIELNRTLKECGCQYQLVTGYGMCELGSTATSTSHKYFKYGSAGYPIKGVTAAAFNVETNAECRYGERGEIRVLTPARMKEYYKRPDATAEFFWKDEEGREWGCTGDVGYVDEDGFVWVEGRATDYFTTKSGSRVYNFDIENVILETEGVYQCEVVGKRTADGWEEPVAFAVLSESAHREQTVAEIRKHCQEKLAAEQIPDEIRILESFPVKPSGKRDMEQLKKMAEKQ